MQIWLQLFTAAAVSCHPHHPCQPLPLEFILYTLLIHSTFCLQAAKLLSFKLSCRPGLALWSGGVWTEMISKVPSDPNHSVFLSKQDHYVWCYILLFLPYHHFPLSFSLLKDSRAQRQPRSGNFWTKSLMSGSKAGGGRSSWSSSQSHLSNLGSTGQTQRTPMTSDNFNFSLSPINNQVKSGAALISFLPMQQLDEL